MPSVSKRFSFKSLKRRFASDDNNTSEKPPSLPPDVEKGGDSVKSPALLTPDPSNESGSSLGTKNLSSASLAKMVPLLSVPSAMVEMPSPQPFVPTLEVVMSPIDPIQNLAATGVMDKIHAGPKSSKAEKVLNKIGMFGPGYCEVILLTSATFYLNRRCCDYNTRSQWNRSYSRTTRQSAP